MAGINYAEGWITMTATTVKMFIDIFIGVWAFILAYIWCAKIDVQAWPEGRAGRDLAPFPQIRHRLRADLRYSCGHVLAVCQSHGPGRKRSCRTEGLGHFLETKMKATTDATALAGLKTELEASKASRRPSTKR